MAKPPKWFPQEIIDDFMKDAEIDFSHLPKPEFSQKYLDAKEELLNSLEKRSRLRKRILIAVAVISIINLPLCIKIISKCITQISRDRVN